MERMSLRLERIKKMADTRALVTEAIQEAIGQVALQNNVSPQKARVAMRAVQEALARDVAARRLADLRAIAEDVALNALADLGYGNAKVQGDLYVAFDDNIKKRVRGV